METVRVGDVDVSALGMCGGARRCAGAALVASLYVGNGIRYHIVFGCNGVLVCVHIPTSAGVVLPIYFLSTSPEIP